jgi:glycosyltransferase involved in cell wall biosynthesis
MKIGVYLDSYTPEDGGAHTFQGGLVDALSQLQGASQHQFTLFISEKARGLENAVGGMPIVQLRGPNAFQKIVAFIARNWPNFRKAIKWRDVAERQMRKAGIEFVWFMSARPKELDLPYLAIVWDLQHRLQPWFPEVSEFGQWEIRERGYQRFLGRASGIVVGTQAGKDEILRFYGVPEDRVLILPHPTPDFALQADEAHSDVAARFGLNNPFLLYPAQFWAHKNHSGILKALSLLKDRQASELDVVFVGADFGNRAYIEKIARELKLEERVHFLGFVERDDLIALYRHAIALVYYSATGPENLPPLEAMALDCPVIVGNVAGAEEQFGEAAILVDPYQPSELAAAIDRLLYDDALRTKLVKRGKKRAANWTSQDFVRGVFDFFDEFNFIRDLWA